jgi:7,8-dihydroneopterin aldolase/epimerase/oxygenase
VTDEVEIRGLRVLGHHGALEGEQARAQPFELDIVFAYEMNAAAQSDDLLDAVDYGGVTNRAARVVAEDRFALLEALGDAVGRAVLEDDRISSVEVRLHKLRPPVPQDVTSIGVVRRLSRTEAASTTDRARA